MLTDDEVSCMLEAFGEGLLDRIKDLRITSRLASDPNSRFIFDCIGQVSINRIGLALITVEAGLSEETAACIFRVIAGTADPYDLLIGQIPEDLDVESVHVLEAEPDAIRCLNDEEALDTFTRMNLVLDLQSPIRGRDILLMMSPTERACVQDNVGNAVLESIQDATVTDTFSAAGPIFDCIGADNLPAIFINVSASRMGSLSDETQACARSVLTDALESNPHPHLVEFALGATNQRPEQFEQAIALSREIFGCMNDDELIKLQETIADAVHRE